MKKLFEIPIYALKESTLNARIRNHIQTLKTNLPLLDPNTASQIIEIETFPKRIWDYNHIIGYICIKATKSDILFDVFMPFPIPKRYVWHSTKKHYFQNIGINGAHIYYGSMKSNEEICLAISKMLDQIISVHIPSRFYVDRVSFDNVNRHLDYLGIIRNV